jgi:L-lactate dehydrogenase complex protein LldG
VAHRAGSLHDVVEIIAGLATRLYARRILAWSDEAIGLPGLNEALAVRGIHVAMPDIPQSNGPERAAALADLAQIALGVTGADAGFAETGTVVLATGRGRPRMASLLVPTHIAILRVDRLVDSVATLLSTRRDLIDAGSNFVCITGPSRTADIEHTLSRGVHGPGEVHVILFEE